MSKERDEKIFDIIEKKKTTKRYSREIVKSVREIQEDIIADFSNLQQSCSSEDLLSHIVDLGKTLAPMPQELKTDSSLVYGCMSKVWISFERCSTPGVRNKRVVNYVGDADSSITKGIIALLFKIFNRQKYDSIVQAELFAIDRIGLISVLGHQRAFGLANIIKHIKMIALLEKTRPRRGRKPKDA